MLDLRSEGEVFHDVPECHDTDHGDHHANISNVIVFCHIYRPWMCPLARVLYLAVSIVTVVIGFYDLYKNIPLLKATAARLCGPLFGWIETWEMASRIKYLGTMLFLHNSERAFKWFLTMSQTMRSLTTIFWLICGILYAPIGLVVGLSNLVGFMFNQMCDIIGDIWLFVSDLFKLASAAESTVDSYEVSIWGTLRNDVFSQNTLSHNPEITRFEQHPKSKETRKQDVGSTLEMILNVYRHKQGK
ncbi:hypothetical protein R6Q57_028760 [Mikania cordata]